MAKAEIMTVLGWDDSAFNRGIARAGSAVATLGRTAANATMGLAKWGSIPALAGGAIFAGLNIKALGAAASMETLNVQFRTLLGSADKAKERMNFLTQFAAETPFELEELVQANKQLEIFSKGVLSGRDGMTLVGDAASIAGQPVNELAMWIGRLYDGLQNNRPVGESLMRLQEMAILSGDVRGEIEKLLEQGLGKEAWKKAEGALRGFSGAMLAQSKTWNGMMSTLGDAFNGILRSFGTPIMERLKPLLDRMITLTGSFEGKAGAFGEKMAGVYEGISEVIAAVLTDPAQLGKGLQLAFLAAGESLLDLLTSGMKKVFIALGSILTAAISDIGASIKAAIFGGSYESKVGGAMASIMGMYGGMTGGTKNRDAFSTWLESFRKTGRDALNSVAPSTSLLPGGGKPGEPLPSDAGYIGGSRLDRLLRMQGGRMGGRSRTVFGQELGQDAVLPGTQSAPFPFTPEWEEWQRANNSKAMGTPKVPSGNDALKNSPVVSQLMKHLTTIATAVSTPLLPEGSTA